MQFKNSFKIRFDAVLSISKNQIQIIHMIKQLTTVIISHVLNELNRFISRLNTYIDTVLLYI